MTKKETLKWSLQILASIISAVLTALGATSCMGLQTLKSKRKSPVVKSIGAFFSHPMMKQMPFATRNSIIHAICRNFILQSQQVEEENGRLFGIRHFSSYFCIKIFDSFFHKLGFQLVLSILFVFELLLVMNLKQDLQGCRSYLLQC